MSTSFFTIDDIKDALKENKWSSGVTWDLNETTNYEVFDYSDMTSTHTNALQSASKVIDSKVLGENDQVLMYWNTALFTNNNNSDMRSIFNSSKNLTEWKSDLSSLTNGNSMFSGTALESFNSDLSNLTNGEYMFYGCPLTTFNADLSSLTIGDIMFCDCPLTTFTSDLSSLTNGSGMFQRCSKLTTFTSDLSNLTNGSLMFYNTALTSFNSDLSSLTNGSGMFYKSALASFNSDLSSLTNGDYMFRYCSNLESFNSDLSSLTDGYWMFIGCKLDTASVKNIADTINTTSSGRIDIGIGNITPNTEEETSFNTIASKGWWVFVNGSSWLSTDGTSNTNLMEGEEQSTPIPYYAKPIQSTEENAEYVDSNNNYYNIVGAQFIYGDDISTYGQFTSFEHAVEEISLSLGLTKYTESTEEK